MYWFSKASVQVNEIHLQSGILYPMHLHAQGTFLLYYTYVKVLIWGSLIFTLHSAEIWTDSQSVSPATTSLSPTEVCNNFVWCKYVPKKIVWHYYKPFVGFNFLYASYINYILYDTIKHTFCIYVFSIIVRYSFIAHSPATASSMWLCTDKFMMENHCNGFNLVARVLCYYLHSSTTYPQHCTPPPLTPLIFMC